MNRQQVVTKGIVLSRTDFAEADRVVTILTPDQGKVRLLAKAVRRPLSKLAGGIELFSVSNITYLKGRGELNTLVSSRLKTHYGNIVNEVNRTMFGYDMLKILNRTTEEAAGEEYFDLLQHMLAALNEPAVDLRLVELVFSIQLLALTGHSPNLQTDSNGKPLTSDQQYLFNYERMAFMPADQGLFGASHIKLLRLAQQGQAPATLQNIKDVEKLLPSTIKLAVQLRRQFLRI